MPINNNTPGGGGGGQPIIPSPTAGDFVAVGANGKIYDSGRNPYDGDINAIGITTADIPNAVNVKAAIDASASGFVKIIGNWNASTNTPTLTAGFGVEGQGYYVSVAGTQTLPFGTPTTCEVNDVVYYPFGGGNWQLVPASQVTSVNGMVGAVTMNLGNINDVTITTPVQYNLLAYDGAEWVNGQVNLASANAVTGILSNANTTATPTNTFDAIVSRDLSGDFEAHFITADAFIGNSSSSTVAINIAGGAANQVVVQTGVSTTDFLPYTSANTVSTFVYRDSSGNFSAGTITAALSGNASTATTLQTPRAIYGNNFDGSAALTQIIASTYGGTGNGFTKFSGATTSEKTYTLPNANATILTDNTLVTLSQGGTNANLTASNGGIFYSTGSAGAILSGTATARQIVLSGSNTAPSWSTATYPATTTINQILYSPSANVIGGLATANNAVLVTDSSGVPSLSTTLPTGRAMQSITGTSGTATQSNNVITFSQNGFGTMGMVGSGSTVTFSPYSGTNLGIGTSALTATSGINNTALGTNACGATSTQQNQVAVGTGALSLATGGGQCVAVGAGSPLAALLTGIYDVAIGYGAGSQYTAAESHNICINSIGVAGESNTLRIGNATGTGTRQLDNSYIYGIYGKSQGGTLGIATINSNSLFGSVSSVPVTLGGTGQTTANAGFNALSPMTTAGDIIYGGTSGVGTRLPTGSGVLVGGTTPAWSTTPTLTGTNFSGIPNSATTATSANTVSTIVARDSSGNFSAGTISAALTGNASTATAWQTARSLWGNSVNGTSDITSIIAATYGGTGNGFTQFTGATTSTKTYTLPNATCTILTTNAAVTVGQGGTGTGTTFTTGSVVFAGASGVYSQDNANFFWDGTNHRMGIGTNAPNSLAKVHIVTTGVNGDYGLYLTGFAASAGYATVWQPSTATDCVYARLNSSAGTQIGTISTTASQTAVLYNTTSDARLKENFVKVTEVLNKICELDVVEYNFKRDKTKHRQIGCTAQNLREKGFGHVVSGREEDFDPKTGEGAMQVGYASLVPILIVAIQELEIRIKELESK